MAKSKVKFWYGDVTQDLSQIVPAIEYYQELWRDGQQHLALKGQLDMLFEEQSGILEYYEGGYTDVAMIRKWLDEHIKHQRARKRIWFMSKEGRAEYGELKKTDIDGYIASDPDIFELVKIGLMLELWENNLRNLVEGLKKRGMYLVMISKVRIAGVHEAYVDSSVESNPETI